MPRFYTGFHTLEEKIKRLALHPARAAAGSPSYTLYYLAPPGPRVKKILALAKEQGLSCVESDRRALDGLVAALPVFSRDHRGAVLAAEGEPEGESSLVDFDDFLAQCSAGEAGDAGEAGPRALVLLLDSLTDPHNIGAIFRSALQFGAALVILPKNNTTREAQQNSVVARSSAGAAAWVPTAVVPNLAQAARRLKDAGFWLYAADPQGEPAPTVRFAPKTALALGSEGSGVSRLLAKECDIPVGIPMDGKVGSLNVSVAAGILLYEVFRQRFAPEESC